MRKTHFMQALDLAVALEEADNATNRAEAIASARMARFELHQREKARDDERRAKRRVKFAMHFA